MPDLYTVHKENTDKSDVDATAILKAEKSVPYSLQGQIPRQALEADVQYFCKEQWRGTVNRRKEKEKTNKQKNLLSV